MSNSMNSTDSSDEPIQALVPKLRFPEFREAEEWASEQLSEVYSFKSTNSLSRDKLNYVAGSVKNIHYGDIHTKFSTHFDVRRERVPFINASEESTVSEGSLCVEGDMIFADASEDVADIGKSIEIVCLSGERVASGQHTILATRTSNRVVIGFGGHVFAAGYVRAQIQKEAQGTKVLGISASRLRNIYLPLPHDQFEQARIADCLSSLDELLAAQARKVEALKAHKKGLMEQLFPREGETQPRLRFPEFQDAGEWEERRLEDLSKRGSGHTPNKAMREYYDGDISWVSLADSKRLDKGWITETETVISEKGIMNSSAVLHPAGSVILSRDAGVGKSAVMSRPMAVSQHFIVWTCDKHILSNWFLYHVLQVKKPIFENVASGSTIKTIGLPFFKELRVSVPSIPEQRRIVDCLSSLDDLIAAETRTHEALKTHKKGLMQQLFPSPQAVEQP